MPVSRGVLVRPHSAHVHLHVLSAFSPHSLVGLKVQRRDLTLSRVFITSSCFRLISLNCTFLENSLYCFILFYFLYIFFIAPVILKKSYDRLSPPAHCLFLFPLPPAQSRATLRSPPPPLPGYLGAQLPSLPLSLSLLTLHTKPLTRRPPPSLQTPRPPPPPPPRSTYFQLLFMLKKTVV